MKTIRHTLLSLVALLGLTACTHNDGDIGIWFGTWQIEDITGATSDFGQARTDNVDYYIQFQGEICTVMCISSMHDQVVDYGTWHEDGDNLTISFPDREVTMRMLLDQLLQGSLNQVFHFTVSRQSDKYVQLKYTNPWGEELTMHLRKSP